MCRFFANYLRRVWFQASLLLLLAGCGGAALKTEPSLLPAVPEQHRQEVVMMALWLTGSPYRHGGRDPVQGFDCSGLVSYVFQNVAGAQLPRSASEQAAVSRRISRRNLQAGDLVFFNTLGRPHSHVGIYIGNGRFVNAPSSGGRVRVDRMDNPYFAKRFTAAGTLFAAR